MVIWVATLLAFLLMVALWAGLVLLAEEVRGWLLRRRKQRRLTRALTMLSMSLEEVLAKAPYKYDHWQGENGYRIFDERIQDGFVGFADNPLDAELWIVERYLWSRTYAVGPEGPEGPE